MGERSGVKKAATLLLCLGVDAAVEITRHLEQSLAYDVIREAARINALDQREVREVLSDFIGDLPDVKRSPSGRRFAAEVLRRSFGHEQATSIDFLKRLDRNQLHDVVENEHPQVAAFVLSYVHPETASALLASLEPERQVEIARRIAHTEAPQREGVAHLVRSLSARLNLLGAADRVTEDVGGVDTLVDIMKNVGREVEQNILLGFDQDEPDLGEQIKKQMFVFEDLVMLDDKAIQKVLKEVDGKVLALALRQASGEIADLLTSNLSERARKILLEDMEAMGRVRVREVDQAQSEIVSIVRRLEGSGEIIVSREDERYV